MIKSTAFLGLKTLTLWITILIVSVISTPLLGMNTDAVGSDGPFSGGQAFLLVNALHAIILATIAQCSSAQGLKLAALIAVTLFFAQCFLLQMEALYFIDNLNVPIVFLYQTIAQSILISITCGLVSVFLWRRVPTGSNAQFEAISYSSSQTLIRIGVTALLYVLAYFLAGTFIAWAAPEIRAYYDFGEDIHLLSLLSFQVLRGAMWGLLALFIVKNLQNGKYGSAVIVGAAFSTLAVAQLLYPSTFMPWDVRFTHLIEVGISNFVFGTLAVLILTHKRPKPI
jgi:hypothetical protein